MADKFTDSMRETESGQPEPVPGAVDVFGLGNLPERKSRREVIVYQDNPNAIQRHDDGSMTYKRFTMTAIGLVLPEEISGDEWEDVGQVIRDLDTSISWVIGDWALFAKREWDATASQIAERFGYETSTIETYTSICEAIPRLIRNQTAHFSHHRLVAKLENPNLQKAWLAYMGGLRLRVADARSDMALLVELEAYEAIECLYQAVDAKKRLSEFDRFKQKSKKLSSKPQKSDSYEMRQNWLEYIRVEEPKRAQMSPDQLERLADRYEWLGQHFLNEAKSIKGK